MTFRQTTYPRLSGVRHVAQSRNGDFQDRARRLLFRDRLPRRGLIVRRFCQPRVLRFCARHDFKARIEVDHGRGELLQYADVALHLCGPVRNLRVERLRAHHRLLEIGRD